MKSIVRTSNDLSENYTLTSDDDPRAIVRYGAVESIATSTGRDDSGVFEVSLRDDRYLPFEYAGAQTSWRLELTSEAPQFDRATISDVVLHILYIARDGGEDLAEAAREGLRTLPIHSALDNDSGHLFAISCRSEFPTEWTVAAADLASELKVALSDSQMPYWMRASGLRVSKVFSLRLAKANNSVSSEAVPKPVDSVGGQYALGSIDSQTFDIFALISAS